MKKLLKKVIPASIRQFVWNYVRAPLNLFRHYGRDAVRYLKFNVWVTTAKDDIFRAREIQMLTHILEKGLSLRDSRPFFGKDVILRLVAALTKARRESNIAPELLNDAGNVLQHYIARHQGIDGKEAEHKFISDLDAALQSVGSCDVQACGTIDVEKDALMEQFQSNPSGFFNARHSIRTFSEEPVQKETIEAAVALAQRAPSACNLQPVRVHVLSDRKMIEQFLSLQLGTRGYGEQIDKLLVISYEIGFAIGPRSRNQGIIDAGLFAMSLMYALLSYGVGTCALHWAVESLVDRKARRLIGLPDSQSIAMLMATGTLPDRFKVALSNRKPVDEVLRFV